MRDRRALRGVGWGEVEWFGLVWFGVCGEGGVAPCWGCNLTRHTYRHDNHATPTTTTFDICRVGACLGWAWAPGGQAQSLCSPPPPYLLPPPPSGTGPQVPTPPLSTPSCMCAATPGRSGCAA